MLLPTGKQITLPTKLHLKQMSRKIFRIVCTPVKQFFTLRYKDNAYNFVYGTLLYCTRHVVFFLIFFALVSVLHIFQVVRNGNFTS
jgi:hypothetical protein